MQSSSPAGRISAANDLGGSLFAIRNRQLGGQLKVLAQLVVAGCLANLANRPFELIPIDVDRKGIEKQGAIWISSSGRCVPLRRRENELDIGSWWSICMMPMKAGTSSRRAVPNRGRGFSLSL